MILTGSLILRRHTTPIGPPVGVLAESRTPTQVMEVWPSRDETVATTADEFNAELDNLVGQALHTCMKTALTISGDG